MITKALAKHIRELHDKKYRTEYQKFLVEGEKNVLELLNSDFAISSLFVTQEFLEKNKTILETKFPEYLVITQEELEKVGTLESNNAALAIVKQKEQKKLELDSQKPEIILALDTVNDPGNLGTITRIADWYGISKIICSENTTDFYNSKTIAATRGSFTRVQVFYTDLAEFLEENNTTTQLPVLGAFLEGENIHSFKYPKSGILLMGSESHGISKELEKLVTQKITIPKYGQAESLNVSIATAIIVDSWKKNL